MTWSKWRGEISCTWRKYLFDAFVLWFQHCIFKGDIFPFLILNFCVYPPLLTFIMLTVNTVSLFNISFCWVAKLPDRTICPTLPHHARCMWFYNIEHSGSHLHTRGWFHISLLLLFCGRYELVETLQSMKRRGIWHLTFGVKWRLYLQRINMQTGMWCGSLQVVQDFVKLILQWPLTLEKHRLYLSSWVLCFPKSPTQHTHFDWQSHQINQRLEKKKYTYIITH